MLKDNKYIQNVKRIVSLLLTAAILTNTLYGCGFDKGSVNDAGVVIPEKKYNAVIEHNEKLSEQTIMVSSAFDDLKSSIKYGQLDKENQQLIKKTDELRNCLDELEDETDKWIKAQEKASKSFSKETRRLFKERTKKYKETVEENRKKAEDILAGFEDSIKENTIEETEGYLNELEEMICPDDINTYGEDIINNADDTVGSGSTISVNNEVIDRVEPSDEAGIVMSDELKAKTHELSTPLNVYNFLRNNINTEFYFGERKGVNGTYDAMAGNDYDQAGLLIAMLRYLGYEAEYVRGTARFTAEQAVGLTSASDIKTAADVMAACGTPVALVTVGEEAKYVDAEHVWVRVNIPYTDYRGALPAEGDKVWLDLDTSVKMYEAVDSIYELMDSKGITDEMSAFVDYGIDTQALYGTDVDSSLDGIAEKIKEDDLTDVYAVNRKIHDVELSYLPASLQYDVTKEQETFSSVKDQDRDRISFTVAGTDIGTYYADETADKSIILSFVPATASDAEIYNSYSSVFDIPAYAVDVKPVTYIDGKEAASAPVEVKLGETLDLNMVIKSSGNITEVANKIKAGSMYAITLDTQMIAPASLERSFEEVKTLKDTINTENAYTVDELGKMLNFAGKLYFAQVDVMDAIAANNLNVSATRSLSEGVTGYEVRTKSVFGVTSALSEGSLFIDVDTDVHSAVYLGDGNIGKDNGLNTVETGGSDLLKNTDSEDVERHFMLVSGFFSSYFESAIWEELTGEASISTISSIKQAIENDIPILTITGNNLQTSLDDLKANDTGKLNTSVINDIVKATSEGKIVVIPQKEAIIGAWSGYGYILLDNETGTGAYMISGGLNGGMSPELVGIAGIIDLTIAVVDLVETVVMVDSLLSMVMIGCVTNPFALAVAGIVGVAMITFALCMLANTFDMIEAAINGDIESAHGIISDIVINAAFFVGIKVAGKVFGNLVNKAISKYIEKKLGSEIVERIIRDYGDEAVEYLRDYGDDFVKICDECGEEGYQLVKKYGKRFVDLYSAYGDDLFKYTKRYGTDGLNLLEKYGDDVLEYANEYGDEVIEILLGENGDRVFAELKNGAKLNQIKELIRINDSDISTIINGQWISINESMSDFSRAYQKQITGREGVVWIENGVKFDGIRNDVLLDAKGHYSQFIDKSSGDFYQWFKGREELEKEALRQIKAAKGKKIKWFFAEEDVMLLLQDYFDQRGIVEIEFVYEPPNWRI